MPIVKEKVPELLAFLSAHGMDEPLRSDFERLVPPTGGPAPVLKGRYIPGSSLQTNLSMLCHEAMQRLFAKFTFQDAPWREAQEAGILVAPLRRPEENVTTPTGGLAAPSPRWRIPSSAVLHVHHGQVGVERDLVGGRPAGPADRRGRGRGAPPAGVGRPVADPDSEGRNGGGASVPARRRPRLRLQLVPSYRRRDAVPGRAGRRGHQGRVEDEPRLAARARGDGAEGGPRGPRSGVGAARGRDRRGDGRRLPEHGRAVPHQEPREVRESRSTCGIRADWPSRSD
jgi:hypothetical protein